MIHFIEIEPEYMAQIEAEITQSATTATDDSLANYASLRLHEDMGGVQYVDIEEGYYIFPVEDEPVTITKPPMTPIHSLNIHLKKMTFHFSHDDHCTNFSGCKSYGGGTACLANQSEGT